MHSEYAIRLKNVSKLYKLFGSQRDQIIDVFGLKRFGIKPRSEPKEFVALRNVNLEVTRGQKIGIIGRNGAGKTTLLKLLTGNFACSSGFVEVNGEVQALMNVGLGFHPEYTGRENVEGSLQYSGLDRKDHQKAIDDIIDFCELGDFLDQPIKTYSLGMQARLMFAAATAIRPDILIVDEVLGAGDAYFVAKSKNRVEKLIDSGCTMLLVSHSMSQVLELCDEAIWLDRGEVRMQGPAFEVVKAYEKFLYKPINGPNEQQPLETKILKQFDPSFENNRNKSAEAQIVRDELQSMEMQKTRSSNIKFQEPEFIPHAVSAYIPGFSASDGFDYPAKGGVTRWNASLPGKLEFTGFSIFNKLGKCNKLNALEPAAFVFEVTAIQGGDYSCRYSVNISNHLGHSLISVKSPKDQFVIETGKSRSVEIVFNPLQLGSGEYIIGVALLEYQPIEKINQSVRYDLLSRSFSFEVELPSSLSAINCQFFHSAEWTFR